MRHPGHWEEVRPLFLEHFQFRPDHEDLIWAKSIWPIMENAGFYAGHPARDERYSGFWVPYDVEAEAQLSQYIIALAILYAGSAWAFGTPDYRQFDAVDRSWLTVTFGSKNNLDETLYEVGAAVCFSFAEHRTFSGDPAFFVPLIRSLVTGSGHHIQGPEQETYLARVAERPDEICEFREDQLFRMWIGGNFTTNDLECFP
jgi:hypothetical protein